MPLSITNNSKQKSLEKLMKAVAFSETELSLNEDGYFSDDQKKKLKPKIELYIALSIIGSLMSFCFAMIFFLIGQSSTEYNLVTIISIAIFGICFFGIFWSVGLKNIVLKGYGVKKTEGVVKLFINYTDSEQNHPVYSMRINGVNFLLDENTFEAFDEKQHRVYYFRILKNQLLSAEPLD